MEKLIYDLYGADLAGEKRNPASVLTQLGISWRRWEAQPIADQIMILDCSGVPAELPTFIRRSSR